MGLATETNTYGPFIVEITPSTGDNYHWAVRWIDLIPGAEPGFGDTILSGAACGRSAARVLSERALLEFIHMTFAVLIAARDAVMQS